jgi:hypothetical protein
MSFGFVDGINYLFGRFPMGQAIGYIFFMKNKKGCHLYP